MNKLLELNVRGVSTADGLLSEPAEGADWSLGTVAGRMVEISGDGDAAGLSLVVSLILEAQRGNEPAAWVSARDSVFFPPDFAAAGIDLEALPVVWIENVAKAAGAADTLLRSGAFGLVVLDLGGAAGASMGLLSRLAGLARKHHTAMICLTRREGRVPNLGSVVSLRGQSGKRRLDGDRFECELRVVRDKQSSSTWEHTEICHGPDGLR